MVNLQKATKIDFEVTSSVCQESCDKYEVRLICTCFIQADKIIEIAVPL